jgi:hypothetical protein
MRKLSRICLVLTLLLGCGGHPVTSTAVAAMSPVLTCSAPALFNGSETDNAFAVYTTCTLSGSGFASADVVYTLSHPFTVSKFTSWLGTPLGSVEETAGEMRVEIPTGVSGVYITKLIFPNQMDKHADIQGSQFRDFDNGVYTLPAGTRLHLSLNIYAQSAASCPNGCGLQLNVYANGPAQ